MDEYLSVWLLFATPEIPDYFYKRIPWCRTRARSGRLCHASITSDLLDSVPTMTITLDLEAVGGYLGWHIRVAPVAFNIRSSSIRAY